MPPLFRPRRLRRTPEIRRLLCETKLSLDDLICPLFVSYSSKGKTAIPSMPGQFRLSLAELLREVQEIKCLGISAILLFGIPQNKDAIASESYYENGIIQKALRAIKETVSDILVITDVCLCSYTNHGHCGILENGKINNDGTLALIAKQACSHAKAGADMVAPSSMMDGMVATIRKELDSHHFEHIPILSYSVKYASSLYTPFRDALESTPVFGDRRSYQMDHANRIEAFKEATLDIEEGADILMVKPAMPFLDIIRQLKDQFVIPLAAYNVSGEYAMVKAASQQGWIDEKAVVLEILSSIKRAGADLIISYHAKEVAKYLS